MQTLRNEPTAIDSYTNRGSFLNTIQNESINLDGVNQNGQGYKGFYTKTASRNGSKT